MRTFALVAVSVALAGCNSCYDFPANANLSFAYAGSGEGLVADFEWLGWIVTPAENALSFEIERFWNGTTYHGYVHYSGLDPAGNVSVVSLEGSLRGTSSTEEALAHLKPVVEPLAQRFTAEAEYGHGATHCGDV